MEQLPDGRWRWKTRGLRPLCFTCMADGDLYRYKHNGESLYFCSPQCADKWAAEHNAEADHVQLTITDGEPYNGAARGYSPYDLMDFECRSCYEQGGAGGYPDPDDYDCCDDAEDYGE